jgi:hypothetical protein
MMQISLVITMAGLRAGHPGSQARYLLPWMGGSSPPMVSLGFLSVETGFLEFRDSLDHYPSVLIGHAGSFAV